MIAVAQIDNLESLLEARDEPMVACQLDWLTDFADVPEDAAPPLAMSGPHPRAVGSYGAECIKWAREEMGITLRWWQALAVTRQLEHDAAGVLVWREIVESGPRRIGKSVRLRIVALWRLAHAERFNETQLAMLVSKDLAVGKEIHRGAWRWADVKGWHVLRLNGAQEIETTKGDRWLLRAPNAVYGYDVGYGQVDESWGVDPQAITDGLEPALLERESPQLHLTSTAHVKASSLMRRRLTAALRNADPDVLLLLWGAPPNADFAAESTWRLASPHWSKDRRDLMARKYAAALAGQDEPEFDDPDPLRGWAAQYLNVWPLLLGTMGDTIFPGWSDLATATPAPPIAALGVAADTNQAWLSLGSASTGDHPHLASALRVPVVEEAKIVDEALRLQTELDCPVAIDPKGPASFLIDTLEDAGVALTHMTGDEVVQACSDIDRSVEQHAVSHGDDDDLNNAVASAGWRPVGDRRVLARRSGDISALESAAFALWLSRNHEADPSVYDF